MPGLYHASSTAGTSDDQNDQSCVTNGIDVSSEDVHIGSTMLGGIILAGVSSQR
jgi:hypothetical protein